jgi:hypothetical protein
MLGDKNFCLDGMDEPLARGLMDWDDHFKDRDEIFRKDDQRAPPFCCTSVTSAE